MNLYFKKHLLNFNFPAGTSRGILKNKETWFVFLENDNIFGVGECSPIRGLSYENVDDIENQLELLKNYIKSNEFSLSDLLIRFKQFPSICFGLETAYLDWLNGGNKMIFNTNFFKGTEKIPINGLIWMGDKEFMLNQVKQKINNGFHCLKMKVGAINFEEEISILKQIRNEFSYKDLEIRLDANGAFNEENVLYKLDQLSIFNIHSIEQPVKPKQIDIMKKVIENSSIDIALDEELIGVFNVNEKLELLSFLHPKYIILKPSLLGGVAECLEWIQICNNLGVEWWFTSALESNIGLNAIAQFASELKVEKLQGLGTGMLYSNNVKSPLIVEKGSIFYNKNIEWDFV